MFLELLKIVLLCLTGYGDKGLGQRATCKSAGAARAFAAHSESWTAYSPLKSYTGTILITISSQSVNTGLRTESMTRS